MTKLPGPDYTIWLIQSLHLSREVGTRQGALILNSGGGGGGGHYSQKDRWAKVHVKVVNDTSLMLHWIASPLSV